MSRRTIFVFGSNLAGVHGAGSARAAYLHHGAELGVGAGPTGDSYAIPTKDESLRTMSLSAIRPYVNEFLKYAEANPDLDFIVVRVGCGLAGYSDEEMAPMFRGASPNVKLHRQWRHTP